MLERSPEKLPTMLVSYSMADVVSSLEDKKKKKKTLRRNMTGTVGRRRLLKPECTHY